MDSGRESVASKAENEPSSSSAHDVESCCGSCLKNIKPRIPAVYKNEVVQVFKLAGPVFISQVMSFMIGFISMVFCGHLGKTELAGVALAIAIINVTGISIGSGLSSACDTLISQTYGSGNVKLVGVILQRGILISLLACFPCWALLINTEAILLVVRQSAEVARLAQLYVTIFMPALPAVFMYQLQGRYLQNQGIIWPQVISGAIGNVFNAIINYIFLHLLDLGIQGSGAANAISQYCLPVILFLYIHIKNLHKVTWDGWSMDCLREWELYLSLALPSMVMMCSEWWLYEVGSFLAGLISETELGAQSVVYELATVVYMMPLGFAVAASVRVGSALGAGNIEQAKISTKVSLGCAFVSSCITGVFLGLTGNVIGYIFTTEKDIIERVAVVMNFYGLVHITEAFAGCIAGIVRGSGKQKVGAAVIFVSYYLVGFPVGLCMMFPLKLGIVGLWTGFLISALGQSVILVIYFYKLNWKNAMEEAQKRAGVITKEDVIVNENKKNSSAQVVCENEAGQTSVVSSLSVKQLVVRRSFTVLLMIIILAAGVFISELLVRALHLKN
ncbi:multidrug and toxin extrusion protein 1-like [Boleophthalmus pectinirostris]|uniref:multidrug and toxin extrusion protein 1-like n=1 Tax=Boleophthalmus pectinirostris TaxID=150288 RepID=UPI00242B3D9F|nr:multidrug and toxin extrusion protein 1-like [Boleophthalmus pectinirostris]